MHLGQEQIVRNRDIIGIFDIENTSIGKGTRDFLAKSERDKKVITVSYEMPKSFIVCVDENGNEITYISMISASTLRKRLLNGG